MKRVLFVVLVCVFVSAAVGASPLQETAKVKLSANAGQSVVEGKDGWYFLGEELRHLAAGKFWGEAAAEASRAKKKEEADPFAAIVAYNKALAEKGVTLYLMPVPPKALVYADKLDGKLSPEAVKEDLALYDSFYEKLAERGVAVVNVLPELLAQRDKVQVYCKTDTHFSGEGMRLFARAAAEKIRKEEWYKSVATKKFPEKKLDVSIVGDLIRMLEKETPKENLELQVVTEEGGGFLVSDVKSPVVLLGDSHTLVYSTGGDLYAKGAGLFDHLSAELGFAVDLLGVRGSGVTPARIKFYQRTRKNTAYLEGKKVLVWCFTARDFTGAGGWKEIPAAP